METPTKEELRYLSVAEKHEVDEENPLLRGKNRSDNYWETLRKQSCRFPIMQAENFERFIRLYIARQVVVVNADTGPDDSRQLVKRILYLELNKRLQVVCTQADDAAAKEIGRRVSEELEVKFGEQVSVHCRKYNKTSNLTRLRFVTEGMLRQQIGNNANLDGYSCVIIDFQEQSTNIDLLLPLLKKALNRRPDLKVVIMAATEPERFASEFSVTEVLNLDKDSFTVNIQYKNAHRSNYCGRALRTVEDIYEDEPPGDILVFLGSTPQVISAVEKLRDLPDTEIIPLYGGMTQKERNEALRSRGEKRRCIVTTNITEKDIGVDPISYVVDSGLQMDSVYNPRVGMKTLKATLTCKEYAYQRAKYAGRTQPGLCYRMYSREIYEDLPNKPSFNKLSDCFKTGLLAIKSAGNIFVTSLETFDFFDSANEEVYLRGLEDIRAMNFIDGNGTMTPAGEAAYKLPTNLNPTWRNAFEEAIELGCLSEIIDIAALTSDHFMDPLSDHLSELNSLYAYLHRKRNMSKEELAIWCHETFLISESLDRALERRQELIEWCQKYLGVSEISSLSLADTDYHDKIRKAIAKGFIHHTATKDIHCRPRQYLILDNLPVFRHGYSALETDWKWVVYHRLVTPATGPQNHCMDRCTVVEEKWLLENDYFYPINLPKDANGKVRVRSIQILFDILKRPYQP